METHTQKVKRHHPLSSTYSFRDGENELGFESHKEKLRTGGVGLSTMTFPKNTQALRSDFQEPRVLQRLFIGKDEEGVRQHVCMHAEKTTKTRHTATPDIDSILVSTEQGLGVFLCGFDYYVGRHVLWNLESNIHWTKEIDIRSQGVEGFSKKKKVPYADIPHLYLGRLQKTERGHVFLMIPGLYQEGSSKQNYTTDELAEKFHDLAFIPAVRNALQGHSRQYHSMSYKEARAKAAAKDELRAQGSKASEDMFWQSLDAELLDEIWESIMNSIDTVPTLTVLKGCFLFLNAKGIKSAPGSKKNGSLFEGLCGIKEKMESCFDLDRIGHENVAVDVGFEWCADHMRRDEDVPTTALWKTCCLRRIHRRLKKYCFNSIQGRVTIYNEGMLRDVGTMGIEPPKKSRFHKEGVLYIQWYNTWKAKADALGTYAFTYKHLSDLSVDEEVWNASASRAGITNHRSYRRIEANYGQSKDRVKNFCSDMGRGDFGTRLEVRMLWRLFLALMDELAPEGYDSNEEHEEQSKATYVYAWPTSMWVIESCSWARFMFARLHAQTSLIEMAASVSPHHGIQTGTMIFNAIGFHVLRHFSNSYIQRSLMLSYKDGQLLGDVARFGLNLPFTMKEWGFGYWDVMVNWENFSFLPVSPPALDAANVTLLGWIRGDIKIMRDLVERLDVCFTALETTLALEPEQRDRMRHRIMDIMAHLVIMQYRYDLCTRLPLKDQIGGDPRSPDSIKFDRQGVLSSFADTPNFMTGSVKWYTKRGKWLLSYLFSDAGVTDEMRSQVRHARKDDEWNRDHFQSLTFRQMYRRIVNNLRSAYGEQGVEEWTERFHNVFFGCMRIVAYPSVYHGSLIAVQSKGQKMKGTRQWWVAVEDRKNGGWEQQGQTARGSVHHRGLGMSFQSASWVAPDWPLFLHFDSQRFRDHVYNVNSMSKVNGLVQLPSKPRIEESWERFPLEEEDKKSDGAQSDEVEEDDGQVNEAMWF
jgi:hypothetical protein